MPTEAASGRACLDMAVEAVARGRVVLVAAVTASCWASAAEGQERRCARRTERRRPGRGRLRAAPSWAKSISIKYQLL